MRAERVRPLGSPPELEGPAHQLLGVVEAALEQRELDLVDGYVPVDGRHPPFGGPADGLVEICVDAADVAEDEPGVGA